MKAALTELSALVDVISADGKITADELSQLRSEIDRMLDLELGDKRKPKT